LFREPVQHGGDIDLCLGRRLSSCCSAWRGLRLRSEADGAAEVEGAAEAERPRMADMMSPKILMGCTPEV
jgi:hypothetical protein